VLICGEKKIAEYALIVCCPQKKAQVN